MATSRAPSVTFRAQRKPIFLSTAPTLSRHLSLLPSLHHVRSSRLPSPLSTPLSVSVSVSVSPSGPLPLLVDVNPFSVPGHTKWCNVWTPSPYSMTLTPFASGPASLNTVRMSRNVITDVKNPQANAQDRHLRRISKQHQKVDRLHTMPQWCLQIV